VHSWVTQIWTHEYFTLLKCYPDPHEYHIFMGYLTSIHKCKETCEYSQVFSIELTEIIQLSNNNIFLECLRVVEVINFIFKSWQVINIDSNQYTCYSYLHKYSWYISKSILGSLKTHRHGYLRFMSMILVSIPMSKLIKTHKWLRVAFSLNNTESIIPAYRLMIHWFWQHWNAILDVR
jgi:hypothetical protein